MLKPDSPEWGLIRAAAQGNNAALTKLLADNDRVMRSAIRKLMPFDEHGQEEVMAAACAKVWRALPTFRGDSSISTWCHKVASTCCLTALRQRNKYRLEQSLDSMGEYLMDTCNESGASLVGDEAPTAEDRMDNKRMAEKVAELLEDIKLVDPRAYELFIASRIDNVPFVKLAAQYGIQRSKVAEEVAFVGRYLREQTGQRPEEQPPTLH